MMIPSAALVEINGESLVQVIEDSTVKITLVNVEEEAANYVRVTKGLTSGMQVVAKFNDELEDGQKIVVK